MRSGFNEEGWLGEALAESRKNWHPGKETQVPFEVCYRALRDVPAMSEPCTILCDQAGHHHYQQQNDDDSFAAPAASATSVLIDADVTQNLSLDNAMVAQTTGGGALSHISLAEAKLARKRTITLKVGGRAQVPEGKTIKIKCKLVRASDGRPLASGTGSRSPLSAQQARVEWFYDGTSIFAQSSSVAERVCAPEEFDQGDGNTDNSIGSAPYLSVPSELITRGASKRLVRQAAAAATSARRYRKRANYSNKQQQVNREQQQKEGRNLSVRSSSNNSNDDDDDETGPLRMAPPSFVPQVGGRFSLVKDNTLRIKRVRADDSGSYTCSIKLSGRTDILLSESIELRVTSKHRKIFNDDQHAVNVAAGGA